MAPKEGSENSEFFCFLILSFVGNYRSDFIIRQVFFITYLDILQFFPIHTLFHSYFFQSSTVSVPGKKGAELVRVYTSSEILLRHFRELRNIRVGARGGSPNPKAWTR